MRARPLAVASLVLVFETSTHLIDFGVYDLRLRALDSADQWSYSHVLATVAYAACAAICTAAAMGAARRRPAWVTAGALFAFLLVDNVGRLHEHVGAWPLLYAPVLVALSVSLVAVGNGTDAARLVSTGLGLLFVSLAIHVLGPPVVRSLGWAPDGWAFQVKVALKEGTELAGWILLVPGLALARRSDSLMCGAPNPHRTVGGERGTQRPSGQGRIVA